MADGVRREPPQHRARPQPLARQQRARRRLARAPVAAARERAVAAAAAALDARDIGFLELREPGPAGTFGRTDVPKQSPAIRSVFAGALVLNSDLDVASGNALLADGLADAISFGRPFIGNPDLVDRIRSGAPWANAPMATWYSQGAEGYTDYPVMSAATA